MRNLHWVVTVTCLAAACAPAFTTVGPYGEERFRHHWIGRDVSEPIAKWGEPDVKLQNGTLFVWRHDVPGEALCMRRLQVDANGLIRQAEITSNCPDLRQLEEMGWLMPVDTSGIMVHYDKFYQVYRVATDPETLFLQRGSVFLEATVVAGYHRDTPTEQTIALLLRDPGAGQPGQARAGVLDIPVAEGLRAEARLLLDNDRAFSVAAIEELPIRGLATEDDYLALVLTPVMEELRIARTIEALLPSGIAIELSPDHTAAIRRSLRLLGDHERIQQLSEQSVQ